MKVSLIITASSFLLAITLTVASEIRGNDKWEWRFAWTTLFLLYGVCVGIVSVLLIHFLSLEEWLAIALSIPLGVPTFLLTTKTAEG